MLPLKSKTCTIISIILLVLCIIMTSFYPSTKYGNYTILVSIMFCSWLFGGISLVFSSKINSKCLKACVILLNLICIFGWIIFD